MTIDGQEGYIFPEKCCWLGLPGNERLAAVLDEEWMNCSAIGGVVGRFRIADGKIWLAGLYKCGGDIPLKDIYPEMDSPAHATWLSGVFYAKVDGHMCNVWPIYRDQYRITYRLELKDGIVTSMQRQDNEICQDDTRWKKGKIDLQADRWRGGNL
ncbi:MAG: hypothetical protein FWD67_10810 [Betaproteobacteria bacterium]|nr:hypothetical protein [Betaproteobacteria bacterium]